MRREVVVAEVADHPAVLDQVQVIAIAVALSKCRHLSFTVFSKELSVIKVLAKL